MMAFSTRVLPLAALVPLVACFAGPPFEPVFFDGVMPDGELVPLPGAFEPLGRLQRHVTPADLTAAGLIGPDPALEELVEDPRDPRIGERVRTQINYAAGKQPIVVKVSPRPYAPLPQVERPLGAASASVPHPVPSPSRPFQGSINGFRRPGEQFGERPSLFNSNVGSFSDGRPFGSNSGSFGGGNSFSGNGGSLNGGSSFGGNSGSFGSGSSFNGGSSFGSSGSFGRPGDRFPSRPRPVVRPGFVIRDNPPTSPPFPETVTGPPYRPPPNGGLREVYRPKPEGPFFVQGRENPDRRGLLAEEVEVNAVGDRPHLAFVDVGDGLERPSAVSETPVSGGRLTARGPLDGGDGTMQVTNVHTVSRVQKPPGSSDRRGRLLNGFAAGALGFPPTPPSAPARLQIASSTLEPNEFAPISPSGALRFTDTLSLTLPGQGSHSRSPIRVTPAGSHGFVSQLRTAGPSFSGFLNTGPSVSLGPGSGSNAFSTLSPFRAGLQAGGRSRKMDGSTRLPFSGSPSGLGVTQALATIPPTAHPLFTSPTAAPFTSGPFGSTAALTEGPATFSLPNGQVSFPGSFAGAPTSFGFPTVTSQRQLSAGAATFGLPNGQVSFSPPRSHIPAGPRLPAHMAQERHFNRRGPSRVAGPTLPFESPSAAGSQQFFGTVRPPFQNQFDPRVRRGFQSNTGLGVGRTLEQEFAAAFGTEFLTGTRQQPNGFGATGRFPNQINNQFGLGRGGQGGFNQGLFPTSTARGRGLFTSPTGITGRNNGFPTTASAFNNRGLFPAGRGGNSGFSSPTGPSTTRGFFPTSQATNRNGLFPTLTSPSSPLNTFPTTRSNRRINAFGQTTAASHPLGGFSTTPSGRSTTGLFSSPTSPTTLNPFSTNPTLSGGGNVFTSPTRLPNNRGLFPTTPSSRRDLFTSSGASTRGSFPTSRSGPTRPNRFRSSTPSGFSDFNRGVTKAGPTMPGRRRFTEEFLPDLDEEVRYFDPPGRQAALHDERLRQASSASGLAGTSLALIAATVLRMLT